MITKQDIKNYSAREDLPGEILIEIIIGKSVDELEHCRAGHIMYPDSSPKDVKKAFPAYITLSTGMINRFHKKPSTQSHKATRIKLKDAIPIKDFCSWFNNEDLPRSFKKQSGFILSSQAKMFVKLVLGTPMAKTKKQDSRHAVSNKHKAEVRKVAKQIWKSNKRMTIADMMCHDKVISISTPHIYSDATYRKWLKDLALSNKPGRRPDKN
tara:strand:+ start:157 stop:789 length:633 start_codon:yes stop_codon:yes gene_type:complete